MSRKPIDQQQPSECRQAVWNEIKDCGGKPFTISDIAKCVRLNISTVRDYIIGLEKADYLTAEKFPTRGVSAIYTLINDIGHDAPRVRKDGSPVTQGQGRQQMWNTMRILRVFTPQELVFNSSTDSHSISLSEAAHYCAALAKAEYLVLRPSGAQGTNGQYMTIPSKWTGPQPPQIQRTKQVYDPNLRRVVWSKIEGGAE